MYDTKSPCTNLVFEHISVNPLDWWLYFKKVFSQWYFLFFFLLELLEGHFLDLYIFLQVQIARPIPINTSLSRFEYSIDGLSLPQTDDTRLLIGLGDKFGDRCNFSTNGLDLFLFLDL